MRDMKKFSEMFYESDNSTNFWNKRGKEAQKNFKISLSVLKNGILESKDLTQEEKEFYWKKHRRLISGYNALSMKVPSGFMTEACIEDILKGKPLNTGDHFYRVSDIADEVRQVFEESNFNIEWMVEEWLPKNYHLWAEVITTKEEHNGDNIIRATTKSFTMEEKDRFEHYVDVSPLIPRKTKKQLLKEKL